MATLRLLPCMPGELARKASDALLLQGVAWYLMIRCWERDGTFSEGAADTGYRSLVDPPMSPFVFSFLVFESVFAAVQLMLCWVCIDGCMVIVALLKREENLFREITIRRTHLAFCA